ncbi:MAG: transcriptional regulator NrdR, partial [Dokdonella sp.]
SVYRKFEDVQAFREEIESLERDLPTMGGLQLPLLEEVAAATAATRRKSKG